MQRSARSPAGRRRSRRRPLPADAEHPASGAARGRPAPCRAPAGPCRRRRQRRPAARGVQLEGAVPSPIGARVADAGGQQLVVRQQRGDYGRAWLVELLCRRLDRAIAARAALYRGASQRWRPSRSPRGGSRSRSMAMAPHAAREASSPPASPTDAVEDRRDAGTGIAHDPVLVDPRMTRRTPSQLCAAGRSGRRRRQISGGSRIRTCVGVANRFTAGLL